MNDILTAVSMVMGILGSVPSVIYAVNRTFFRPKVKLTIDSEAPNELMVAIRTGLREIVLDSVKVWYDEQTCSVVSQHLPTEHPLERVSYRKHGILSSIEFTEFRGRRTRGTAFWFSIMLHPGSETCQEKIIVTVKSHLPEDSLPFLIDMFPPKTTTAQLTHLVHLRSL